MFLKQIYIFACCLLVVALGDLLSISASCHLPAEETNTLGSFDIVLPQTTVPAELTTYTCYAQTIPLSPDREYYAVAFEPLIINKDVMHHMILFGCSNIPPPEAQSPHYCGPQDNQCRNFVMQWSMGITEPMCSPPNTGVKFGLFSLKHLALQIHWNNANRLNGTTDASGVRVYFTHKPRKYELGNVQVGQNDLEIPPQQSYFSQTGSCSSDCTNEWLEKHSIYITRAHIHMHYTGAGGKLELVRGSKIIEVINDETYDYNSPPAHTFPKPVEVRKGDEIRVTCYFNTKDGPRQRNQTVYWKEGSDGEMCYAFITYYPRIPNFDQCIQFDKYDICSGSPVAAIGECVFGGFKRAFERGMSKEILKQCDKNFDKDSESSNTNPTNIELRQGKSKKAQSDKICSKDCDIAIREVTEHPCMQGRLGHHTRRVYLPQTSDWSRVRDMLDEWKKKCYD